MSWGKNKAPQRRVERQAGTWRLGRRRARERWDGMEQYMDQVPADLRWSYVSVLGNGEERIIRMRAKSGQVLDDVTGKGKVLGET